MDFNGAVDHPLLAEYLDLHLASNDHAIFGSGPLLARGWIPQVCDLDIITRGLAWKQALAVGSLSRDEEHDIELVKIGSGITVGDRWMIGSTTVDELLDTAEMIGPFRCVRLSHVIRYKRLAARPKDREHLAVIAASVGSTGWEE